MLSVPCIGSVVCADERYRRDGIFFCRAATNGTATLLYAA